METTIVYIIWSEEHRGWWKPNERGYTPKREEAGHYEFERAQEICMSANINERDVPNEAIVPIEVCAFCLGTGEVTTMEAVYAGESHQAPIGTKVCICQKQ